MRKDWNFSELFLLVNLILYCRHIFRSRCREFWILCTLGDEPIKVYWTPNSKIYFIFSVLGSMLMALLPTNHVETQRPGVKNIEQMPSWFFFSFIPTRPRFCFRHWFLDYFFCPLLSSHVYPLAISMFKICVEIPHSNGSVRLGRVFLMNTHENLKYSTVSTLLPSFVFFVYTGGRTNKGLLNPKL